MTRTEADLECTGCANSDQVEYTTRLACSPRHPLAQNLALQMSALDGQRYIHFDRNLIIRRQVDRFLRAQGVSVRVVHEFDNIENIKQAVAVGAGVALLPEPTLRREVRARTLIALPLFDCRLVRPLGIIHRRRHKLSRAALRFVELLRNQEDRLAPQRRGTRGDGNGAIEHHRNAAQPRGRNGAARSSRRTGP